VPFDCGYAFVADADAHRATMSIRAPYISAETTARDQIDWNPEWSRRARAFSTYAALRELGRTGARTEAVIDHVVTSGEAFFGATTWRGARAMRVSVLNWQTTERDIARAVAAVRAALHACSASG
jgi:hypothetical protein